MRLIQARIVAWAGLLLLAAGAARGQQAPAMVPTALTQSGTVVRVIDDLPLSKRWLLLRDAGHPAGPGRMVLAALNPGLTATASGIAPELKLAGPSPVIRIGDRVMVEEETAVVDVHLEAVALGAAIAGGVFEARLTIGGNRVRVVALGPGRAAIAPEVSP